MSLLGKMLGFGRNAHYDKGIRLFDQAQYEEAVIEFGLAKNAKGGRSDLLPIACLRSIQPNPRRPGTCRA